MKLKRYGFKAMALLVVYLLALCSTAVCSLSCRCAVFSEEVHRHTHALCCAQAADTEEHAHTAGLHAACSCGSHHSNAFADLSATFESRLSLDELYNIEVLDLFNAALPGDPAAEPMLVACGVCFDKRPESWAVTVERAAVGLRAPPVLA